MRCSPSATRVRKSFGAKQNFIRSIEQSEDRIGIILEPLNNWAGVAEALGGTRITVGGDMGLNPLEIKPTPERIQRAMGRTRVHTEKSSTV